MRTQLRLLYRRTALIRAALMVFLLTVVLIAAVVVTLDHNARRANAQQAASNLTAAARVSASSFATIRADLRANVSQLAGSLSVQHALLAGDDAALARIAKTQGGAIVTRNKRFDALPRRPRLMATAKVAAGDDTVAWVTLGIQVGPPLLKLLGEASKLRRQARTDSLTGLVNRRAFDDRLGRELETAGSLGYEVTLVMCDLDNFKAINDRYGHLAGDEVLRAVGRVFSESVRDRDIAARYGGEELALVLPGTPLIGGRRLSERIRRKLEELRVETADGETIVFTASFGAATFPTHAYAERLLAAADSALYEAKDAGRNRVVAATARKKHEELATATAC